MAFPRFRNLRIMVFIITIGTSFHFGYHTGVMNALQTYIEDFIIDVHSTRYGEIDRPGAVFLFSVCVTTFLIGGMIGGLTIGLLLRYFGRRSTLLILSIPTMVGSLMMGLSKEAHSFIMIILGRFITGLACGGFFASLLITPGAYTVLAPLYLTELAPIRLRGSVGVANQLVVVLGLMFSQVVGLPAIFGSSKLWPIALGSANCFLSVLIHNLKILHRDPDVVDREAQALAAEEMKRAKVPIWKLCGVKYLRMAILIIVVAQISQQFSAINGILYYSVDLFEKIGLTPLQASYANLGVGGSIVFITLVSLFIIEKLGRRILLIGGLLVALIALCLYTGSLLINRYIGVHWPVYIAVVMIYIFVCAFGIGPGSIPWFLAAEMFKQDYRDGASTIAVVTNWSCNILVGLVFPQLVAHIGIYSFVPFAIILCVSIVFLAFHLPETMGRSPTDIDAQLRHRYGQPYFEAFVDAVPNEEA